MTMNRSLILILCGVYVVCGVYTSIASQFIKEWGAGDSRVLLTNFCGLMGYAISGLLPNTKSPQQYSKKGFAHVTYFVLIAAIEVAGSFLCNAGFNMIGSGLYQVCYSGTIVFTTILSVMFLSRRPSKLQIMGVSAITFGLLINALGSKSSGDVNSVNLNGIFVTLGGVVCYATSAVIQDYLINIRKDLQISGSDICVFCGGMETAAVLFYQIMFTLPRWHELMSMPIKLAGGEPSEIIVLSITIVISTTMSCYVYFLLIAELGAVSTCLLQAATTTGVFFSSAVLFCNARNPQQCITVPKGISVSCVISGILIYGYGSKQATKVEKRE